MMRHMQALVRRRPPTPRPGVYELYWSFASRRHRAFEARLAGANQPWSNDPILQIFKFCNVFRALDRVSQFLIKEVAYGENPLSTPEDRVFQIVAFRMFSNIRTWQEVTRLLGGAPRISHLRSGDFLRVLDQVKVEKGGLYTGAFILCANKAFGFDEKHRNHVALFRHMFVDQQCASRVIETPSMQALVALLQSFPLMGPFMAYQTAIDINYSTLTDFSENDYVQAGPGALRGLKKAFTDLGDYSPADAILWMVDRQHKEFARLRLPFNGLFGRPLHGIDCQGLFCELDKYCREAMPELSSARSRIKARFNASAQPIALFLPPKWDLPAPGTLPGMARSGPWGNAKAGRLKEYAFQRNLDLFED
ncbi:nucleotide kinase domain-containing protein [Variovorax robiniae]|uniref:Nucleotide kinase domain-containing protein n=1 Tax=Variovorax robiniae TaxID=1836199 RepID=A0ABU8XJX0_9BURK